MSTLSLDSTLFLGIKNQVVAWLREGIPDPLGVGARPKQPGVLSTLWIFPDYPRTDAMRPRIAVNITAEAQSRPVEVGNGVWERRVRLEVDVYADDKNVQIPGMSSKIKATTLADYLSGQIEHVLMVNKKDNWEEVGIRELSPSGVVPWPYNINRTEFRLTKVYQMLIRYPTGI